MKTLLLSLLAVSPIFSVLAPHAEAGAIAANSSGLSPRLIGPGASGRARAGFVPTGAIKLPRLARASHEIVQTVLGTNLSGGTSGAGTVNLTGGTVNVVSWSNIGSRTLEINNSGSLVKTGAGTLTLDGTSSFAVNQSLSGLVIGSNAVVTLDALGPPAPTGALTLGSPSGYNGGAILTVGNSTLNTGTAGVIFVTNRWSVSDPAATLVWASGIDERVLALENFNGTIQIGLRELAANDGTASVAAPVPEPASTILLVIGAAALSRARRRRES